MFDIGGGEFLLLVILGLLVFGPRRLPQIGRQFGGWVAQMRRAMNDFRGTLEREVALDDVRKAAREVQGLTGEARRMTQDLVGSVGAPPPADPQRRLRESRAADSEEKSGPGGAGEATGSLPGSEDEELGEPPTAAEIESREDLERQRQRPAAEDAAP